MRAGGCALFDIDVEAADSGDDLGNLAATVDIEIVEGGLFGHRVAAEGGAGVGRGMGSRIVLRSRTCDRGTMKRGYSSRQA